MQSFKQCDTDRDGFILADEARGLLAQSGLANGILAQIWTLSDMDKDGKLNENEFVVAMALVNRGTPTRAAAERRAAG
jgi:Ca2+-binding EF-hand superfamily protein